MLLLALALAAASGASVLWLDEPLARFIHAHGQGLAPFWLAGTDAFDVLTAMDLWKYFAGGVFVVAGLVASLSARLREHARALWFVAATHLASRLSTTPWKALFARLRPYLWFDRGEPARTFFAGGNGFPSGHVIYYLSLCLPLALCYRRPRVALLLVPVFLAVARMGAEQHFLGDTLAAAAWVTFVTWLLRTIMLRTPPAPATRPQGS
jgi:membrane-associated phospholipid phosphatase